MDAGKKRIKSRIVREDAAPGRPDWRLFASFLPPSEDFEESAVDFNDVLSVTIRSKKYSRPLPGSPSGETECMKFDFSRKAGGQSAVELGAYDVTDVEFWEYCGVDAGLLGQDLVLNAPKVFGRIADFADGQFLDYSGRKFQTEAEFADAFYKAADKAGFRLSEEDGRGVVRFDHRGATEFEVKMVLRG